ncbi:TPA: hypothetical protein ACS70C_003266 [Providencia alcalifaciens]
MNMINIKTAIKKCIIPILFFAIFDSNANTKVIGLIINQSSLDDVVKLYETEKDGVNSYSISPDQIPLKGVSETFVTVIDDVVKVVGFKFYDSKFPYLNDILKAKYTLVSEKGNYPFPAISTFENDGDMIFLKYNGGQYIGLIYVNKEYNILVNKSSKKRKETERDNDLSHL